MAEKKKNNTNRLGTIPFTVLWTLAYGLGWATVMIGGIITDEFFPQVFRWFPSIIYIILGLAVPTFVYSVAQQLLMRWKFAIHFRWWFLWSTLAAALGAGSLQIIEWLNIDLPYIAPIFAISLVFSYLFAIPSLVQAWMLQKHVKRSWMWPLAAIASAATFAAPLAGASFFSEWVLVTTFGFAGLLQGAVMALTMVWLFGMTRVEPLKRGMDTAQIEAAEAKLAERDMTTDNEAATVHEAAMRERL